MAKIKLLTPLLILLAFCLNLVQSETVGVKENLKDLEDDDVLVISVSHAKKDMQNSTAEKLILKSTQADFSTTTTTTSTSTPHPIVKKEVEEV